jgi:hypothetical protein
MTRSWAACANVRRSATTAMSTTSVVVCSDLMTFAATSCPTQFDNDANRKLRGWVLAGSGAVELPIVV